MVGRNEPCPCGSGKKYKKCCESKQQLSIEKVYIEEVEQILQTFYNSYPERKDIREFFELVQVWLPKLENHLQRELIESVALDDYFFHQRQDIWTNYLKRSIKKSIRPTTIELLKNWNNPKMFLGQVVTIEERYFKAICSMTGKQFMIRRESTKPIPEGMQLFAFLLPDGLGNESHYLAASTLIFFPEQYKQAFDAFANSYDSSSNETIEQYLKVHHLDFWTQLVAAGYSGEEFTSFELQVIEQIKQFLIERNISSEKLIEMVEDYLVAQQPKARKASAIAAGAIRFGQARDLFESQTFTIKEIAESFGVSTSSLNKYYQELLDYNTVTAV